MELGYGLTSSVEECRSSLSRLGVRDINPTCAAKVLSHMARTCSGLEDAAGLHSFWGSGSNQENKDKLDTPTTWNVEVFVQTIREIVSN